MKRLAEFVEVDCSENRIAEIVDICSFENMKHADKNYKKSHPGRFTKTGESAIFRKGRTFVLFRVK